LQAQVRFPNVAGAALMALFATACNLTFAWRRYPLALWSRFAVPAAVAREDGDAGIVAALAGIDTLTHIPGEDLLRTCRIAARHKAHDRRP
jgi:hypothetical protein